MRRLLALAALVAVSAAAAPLVHAQTPPAPAQGVNVVPDPASTRRSEAGTLAELGTVVLGQPLVDAVVVRSSFDEPREVLLYAADAEPAVGGGFGFSERDAAQEQVGAWLRLEQERVTVPAGGSVRVGYAVTVPPRTEGGEYVGAVVAEPVEQAGGSGVPSRTRFAMAVYLRVPGGSAGATPGRGSPDGEVVLEALAPGFDGSRACPVVRYRNDSQDVVDPVATVRTDGVVGGTSLRQERVGALLPGSSAEVALRCLERPVGPGSLSVELSSPQGGGAETARYTWLPWPFVLALLLMLLLASAVLTTLVRGLREGRSPQVGHDSADRAGT
jgi:hypothetical protein